jgi:hypothetical protein
MLSVAFLDYYAGFRYAVSHVCLVSRFYIIMLVFVMLCVTYAKCRVFKLLCWFSLGCVSCMFGVAFLDYYAGFRYAVCHVCLVSRF